MDERLTFTAPLWAWNSATSWYFVSLPARDSAEIRDRPRPPRAFGSVKVRATTGGSTWVTSIFPDSKSGVYVLPMKKAIRSAERMTEGDAIEVTVDLLE